jgi:hypothetical protein
MKMKPIHAMVLALIVLLLAAGTVHRLQNRSPQTGGLKPNGAVENHPAAGRNEVADGHVAGSRSEGRARNRPAPITDLDEAERLLMEFEIDPSNRDEQAEHRLRALLRRIDPSLLGQLLARIDAELIESGYFKAKEKPPSALAGAEVPTFNESDRKKDFFREFLVREWATHALDDSLAYALNADRRHYRESFVIAALSTRVTDDPLDAMARVAELPEPELSDRVRPEVYRAWLLEAPVSAMSWAKDWPDARQRKGYLQMWGAEVAKTEPDLALRAAAGIQNEEERLAATGGIASTWSLRDPQTMAVYLRNNPTSNAADNQAMVSSLVYNWYQRDKQSTLDWISGLPEGPVRGEAERFLTQVMKVEWPPKAP